MKKILAIVLPILIIIAGLVLLYKFVLVDLLDPPPEKVMESAIEAAQAFVNSDNENNRIEFVEHFSERAQRGLQREWNALNLENYPRGSWYQMAVGLLNSDGTLSVVIGTVAAEGEEEGEEAEEEEEATSAVVQIEIDRDTRDIPFVRQDGEWRIDIPVHPTPRVARPDS